MKAAGRTATAVGLAAALVFAGGIGLFRGSVDAGTSATRVDVRAGDPAILTPAIGAASLEVSILALQERVRAVPSDARALAQLGLAYVAQARVTADPSWYPKAEGVLSASLRLNDQDNVEAVLGEGALALARHDFEVALRLGHRAQRLNPYDADVYGVIGDAELELGRYDLAFDTFQTMVDTKPELASYARVSYARELLGDIAGALDAMQMAFDAAGSQADAAWAAFQLGELEWNRGNVRAARTWYERGLELDPGYVPNAAGLAKVAWASGDTGLAIERYTDVVARYPSVEYVSALGDLYATTGRDDLAAQQYAVVEATRQLQQANGVNVDLEVALFDADHGDPAGALEAARAEWARRQSVHVADAYAWALYANGEFARAATLSHRALELGTRNAAFLFHAGMIERALGDDAEALRLLYRARALNPNFSILHAPIVERVVADLGTGR